MATYWGKRGAGIMFACTKTGRVLLTLRSEEVTEPGTWGIPGGKIDSDENSVEAAKREAFEELGREPDYVVIRDPLYVFTDRDFRYTTYLALVPKEFKPELNWEADDYRWVKPGDWPEPLHFGVRRIVEDEAAMRALRMWLREAPAKLAGVAAPRCGSCGGDLGAVKLPQLPAGQNPKVYGVYTKLMEQLSPGGGEKQALGLSSTTKLGGEGGRNERRLAFALPAGPAFACPGATGECAACYAQHGRLALPTQAARYVKNWLRWRWLERQKDGREQAARELVDLIRGESNFFYRSPDGDPMPVIFRVWESGDFHSQWSVDVWTEVCRRLPKVLFWTYTRSFHLDMRALVALPNVRLFASTDRYNTTAAKAFVAAHPQVGHAYGPWRLAAGLPPDTFACPATRPVGVVHDPKAHGGHQWKTTMVLPISGRPEAGWPPGACGTCRFCAPKAAGGLFSHVRAPNVAFYDHAEAADTARAAALVQLRRGRGQTDTIPDAEFERQVEELNADKRAKLRAFSTLGGLSRSTPFAADCQFNTGEDGHFP